MAVILYTSKEVPMMFIGHFHEVCEMIDNAFNDYYSTEYILLLLWISCSNDSMNSWLNKSSPGFMTFPCNHQKQNVVPCYQSKTIIEHKNVTYKGHLCPIVVKSSLAPKEPASQQIIHKPYRELKSSSPDT